MSTTKEWKRYEKGIAFNKKKDYYDKSNLNLKFFKGDQWVGVQSNGMPTPVFNVIKRAIQFFVSNLMSSDVKVQFTPLEYRADEELEFGGTASDMATAEIDNILDKCKFENRSREALFEAAITGDSAMHIYFNPTKKPYNGTQGQFLGEIEMELLGGGNVFLGNPNSSIISTTTQPYVILDGRDSVANLKREAKFYKESPEIETDDSKETMSLQTDEIEADEESEDGKATYIIYYYYDHETETIKATKCTEKAYIYKDIDLEYSNYPVAFLNWEKQNNSYHGVGVTEAVIPNQIFINRMFAMVFHHLSIAAFPKAVYDSDRISHWSNRIGEAIAVSGLMPGESMQSIATYLEPGNMSNQIVQVLELAIQYTKEVIGINEAMMGDINPEAASGKAIIATVQQSVVPLENVKSNYYEWVENIGIILLDIMGTKYGLRPIQVEMTDPIDPMQGKVKQMLEFDFGMLKNTYLNCKVDVGAANYYSEIAAAKTLDGLFEKGALEVLEYLEAMPTGYIPKKQQLMNKIKERVDLQAQMELQMASMPPNTETLEMQ